MVKSIIKGVLICGASLCAGLVACAILVRKSNEREIKRCMESLDEAVEEIERLSAIVTEDSDDDLKEELKYWKSRKEDCERDLNVYRLVM